MGVLRSISAIDHEAGTQTAVRSQPQPVAGVTEIVADGADEADDPPGTLQPEKPGRPLDLLPLLSVFDGQELAHAADPFHELIIGDILLTFSPCAPIGMSSIKRI